MAKMSKYIKKHDKTSSRSIEKEDNHSSAILLTLGKKKKNANRDSSFMYKKGGINGKRKN